MPVVQEDENHPSLVWVRCPDCSEIKPVDTKAYDQEDEKSIAAHHTGVQENNPTDAHSRRVVRHYRAGEKFLTGEWIYHPEWDDTGRIIEKCRSMGGREVIVVAFERVGTRRLVSNFMR